MKRIRPREFLESLQLERTKHAKNAKDVLSDETILEEDASPFSRILECMGFFHHAQHHGLLDLYDFTLLCLVSKRTREVLRQCVISLRKLQRPITVACALLSTQKFKKELEWLHKNDVYITLLDYLYAFVHQPRTREDLRRISRHVQNLASRFMLPHLVDCNVFRDACIQTLTETSGFSLLHDEGFVSMGSIEAAVRAARHGTPAMQQWYRENLKIYSDFDDLVLPLINNKRWSDAEIVLVKLFKPTRHLGDLLRFHRDDPHVVSLFKAYGGTMTEKLFHQFLRADNDWSQMWMRGLLKCDQDNQKRVLQFQAERSDEIGCFYSTWLVDYPDMSPEMRDILLDYELLYF